MALGVDLFGVNAAGSITWRRMCRCWEGSQLLDLLSGRLKPADPDPSWECFLSADDVRELSGRFDKLDLQSRYPNDPDLAQILQEPDTDHILLRIEEWGYG